MKKLSFFAIAALFAVSSVLFTACTKKETVETNNSGMSDSDGVPDGNIDIVYSVNVVSAANATTGKTNASVAGAVVTVAQGEVTKQITVKDDGIATFNLKPGIVTGTVSLANHTTVRFTANLHNGAADHVDAGQTRFASTIITLWSTTEGTATIKGKLTYDNDLTVAGVSDASNKKITATLANSFAYPNMNPGTAGEIVSVVIEGTTLAVTTGGNGEYTLTVPASSNGVPMTLTFEEFVEPQKQTATMTNNRYVYTINPVNITVRSGQTYVVDEQYN